MSSNRTNKFKNGRHAKEREVSLHDLHRQGGESQLLGEVTLELQPEARIGGAGAAFQVMRTARPKALWPAGARLMSRAEKKLIKWVGTRGKMGLWKQAGARFHRAL